MLYGTPGITLHVLSLHALHELFTQEDPLCDAPQGGDAGGQAAITELIQEATLLSRMRHPNVVWVYGVVLKPMTKDDENTDDDLNDQDGG